MKNRINIQFTYLVCKITIIKRNCGTPDNTTISLVLFCISKLVEYYLTQLNFYFIINK